MVGFVKDITLARKTRRMVAAAKPAQLADTGARSVDQMLATVELAVGTAEGQLQHPTAQAYAEALLKHRSQLAGFVRACSVR